jgi:hypothetical protein
MEREMEMEEWHSDKQDTEERDIEKRRDSTEESRHSTREQASGYSTCAEDEPHSSLCFVRAGGRACLERSKAALKGPGQVGRLEDWSEGETSRGVGTEAQTHFPALFVL